MSFGAEIDYLLYVQKKYNMRHSKEFSEELPFSLTLLCDSIRNSADFNQKGLFRIAAPREDLITARAELEKGNSSSLKGRDIHISADLLKILLRTLNSSVINAELYEHCLSVSSLPDQVLSIFSQLSSSHSNVLAYLLDFLCDLLAHESTTLMSADNLAIVFSQDLLRSNITDPQTLFLNSSKEATFIKNLIEQWRLGRRPY